MEHMQPHEKKQAEILIDLLLADGGKVSVNDGEETTVKESTDRAAILAAMCSTGEDLIAWHDARGHRVGIFWLIYGNGEGELIADYHDNRPCNEIWNKLQEQLS